MMNFKDVGRLTKDPELKVLPGGKSVAQFVLAVNSNFKDKDGKNRVDFHPIQVWGKLAEACANNLEKGRLIMVTGNVRNNNYEGADGKMVYGYRIIAQDIRFLDYSKNENQEFTSCEDDEDIPF